MIDELPNPELAHKDPKAKLIADLSDTATRTLLQAQKIERDPIRRRTLGTAAMIKQQRAFHPEWTPGQPYSRNHTLGLWLLLRATPKELHEIADALAIEDEQIAGSRRNIITAYQSALEQTDPRFRWWDESIPGRICTITPLPFVNKIKFPPPLLLIAQHFVVIFGKPPQSGCLPTKWDGDGLQKLCPCLPAERSIRKTITETYGLPLARSKSSGRPKKRRNRSVFRVP
jgi:hypothetical protein